MPGVVVHAFALRTLLNHDWIRGENLLGTWLVALTSALLVCLSVYLVRPWAALLVMLGAGAAVLAISVIAFRARVWIGPVEPLLCLVLSGLVGFVYRSAFARQSLDRFAGEEAARSLERHGSIDTRVQRATVLFADVRGYTTLSETLSPAELMEVLNEHFEWMDGIIVRHEGRVDKHIGDALMAVFEGTRRGKSHAERAVRAAQEMVATAGARRGRAAEIEFGIGVHTGETSTGVLGHKERKQEFGTIGDAVNVAARLEQNTRALDVQLLVSEDTIHEGDVNDLRRLEPLTLKGRTEPVVVYTLPN
jgi:adenylate cyclase